MNTQTVKTMQENLKRDIGTFGLVYTEFMKETLLRYDKYLGAVK